MQNFSEKEEEILEFWKENKIFEKSLEKTKDGQDFVFYDGPMTVNAKPGIHHVLARIFKDIIPRFKTMQGYNVQRKNGWDTHGLPVELEVEKKLNLKTKKDIQEYGIAKFNKACRKNIAEYLPFFQDLTERIAYWVDMDNSYATCENEYIETVWQIIKQISNKKLLYQDYRVAPYCTRCGTGLSSHELAQGYKKIKEPAIYVKFELKKDFRFQVSGFKTYLLVWTTTPWTLPGNVAIAVNPDITYLLVKKSKESFIVAKERIAVLGEEAEILEEIKGEELIGLSYEPIFSKEYLDLTIQDKEIYKILPASFVNTKEGTGLVHIAPAFGQDDMELIKAQNAKCKVQNKEEYLEVQNAKCKVQNKEEYLEVQNAKCKVQNKEEYLEVQNAKCKVQNNEFPILLTVDKQGKFKNEVKKWTGIFVKKADSLIIEHLKENEKLFKEEEYEHDYPFCWRCKSPLLYYAKKGWFIKMSELRKELLERNKEINWMPSHLKQGRFGEWLKEAKDWNLSRERYWGTPLPVWKCKECKHQEFIGSKKDLLKQKFSSNKYILLRHGQNKYQEESKDAIYPSFKNDSVQLSKQGVAQIEKVAKELKKEKIDIIFSSDFLRTKETAKIINKEVNTEIIFDKRLRDLNLGIWHGKTKEEFFENFDLKDLFWKAPEEGESWMDVKKRMYDFLISIDKKYKDKNILIIGHGEPLWLLEGIINGQSNEELWDFKNGKKNYINVSEVRKISFKKLPHNEDMELDFHRPYIDEVKFCCPKCENLMERVPEVIDCWFDSGAMPFAQNHWPFNSNNSPNPPKLFPANYISEAIDQTRGWFYTLLAVSTLLGFSTPYKNVLCLGHILDEKGEKMSKSKGNIVEPWEEIKKHGADAIRWYFFSVNNPGDSKRYSSQEVKAQWQRVGSTLLNCLNFFNICVNEEKFNPYIINSEIKTELSLDRWFASLINKAIKEVEEDLEKLRVDKAAKKIEYLIDNFSNWYLRRSRKRLQGSGGNQALEYYYSALFNIVLLVAPFIPFLSEIIFKELSKFSKEKLSESVHLENWPKFQQTNIDEQLEEKMIKLRRVVNLALAERAKTGIKVRQPLRQLTINNKQLTINKELLDLIKEEVNVKEVIFNPKIKKEVELDTKITSELKEEGIVREIIREIQGMRKKAGLKPKDEIIVEYLGLNKQIFEKNKDIISEQTNIKKLVLADKEEKLITIKKL